MLKSELDTPSLILDLDLFEKNLKTMRDFAVAAGKKLRPHAKTHKSPEIARRQLECGNCVGVCAAKLSEAEVLAAAGISEILITSPVSAPWKIARIGSLHQKINSLQLTVDHPFQVEQLASVATADHPIHVLIDVDPEMGRTGVAFENALEFAHFIARFPELVLDGVQCYAGHLQHIPEGSKRNAESTRLMKKGAAAYRTIAAEFSTCRIFTGTGTGTSAADVLIPEVTDIQVGSYCVMDAEYLAVEHTGPQYLPALRILSSVISCNHPGHATIDAGTKAIYVTPGAPPRVIDGNTFRPAVNYDWNYGDEHGHLMFPSEQTMLPGERLELVVSHCDPTINLFDEFWVVRDDTVVDRWEIQLRGCCR
ncbi:MAG: DSD1 family PLP-dependent enzyme [Lentisphaeria bacterium]|nr:DSD1 family PLP-dependent enzyme [Lentisphaeria bacterium]